MTIRDFIKSTIEPLHRTKRWGPYSTNNDMDVASHTFDVCVLAHQYALQVDEADEQLVLEKALYHDIEESETGDIPRFVKRQSETLESELDAVETEVMLDRVEEIGDEQSQITTMERWSEAKDHSIEGRIVKAADIVSAMQDVKREERLGNTYLREQANVENGEKDAIEICEDIEPAQRDLEELLGRDIYPVAKAADD